MENASEFTNLLINLLQGIANKDDDIIEESIDEIHKGLSNRHEITSFKDAGLMTNNDGLIVEFENNRLQISVINA